MDAVKERRRTILIIPTLLLDAVNAQMFTPRGSRERMSASEVLFGAASAFDPAHGREFLRGLQPEVLQTDARSRKLDLGPLFVSNVYGSNVRFSQTAPSTPAIDIYMDTQELKAYNPAIAAAPTGLCDRCAYVAAVRVDALHQCPNGSKWELLEAALAPGVRGGRGVRGARRGGGGGNGGTSGGGGGCGKGARRRH